jgi:hypothetical protein
LCDQSVAQVPGDILVILIGRARLRRERCNEEIQTFCLRLSDALLDLDLGTFPVYVLASASLGINKLQLMIFLLGHTQPGPSSGSGPLEASGRHLEPWYPMESYMI